MNKTTINVIEKDEHLMVVINDRKVGANTQIIALYKTRGEAIRSFAIGCKEGRIAGVNAFPEDYELCIIGKFDKLSLKIETMEKPEAIAYATDYIERGAK